MFISIILYLILLKINILAKFSSLFSHHQRSNTNACREQNLEQNEIG